MAEIPWGVGPVSPHRKAGKVRPCCVCTDSRLGGHRAREHDGAYGYLPCPELAIVIGWNPCRQTGAPSQVVVGCGEARFSASRGLWPPEKVSTPGTKTILVLVPFCPLSQRKGRLLGQLP